MAIHANWNDRSLLLWGGLGDATPRLADADSLRDLVGQVSPDALLASIAQATTVRLWLPSDDAGPVTQCVAGAAASLRVVEVPALRFSAAEAMDLLLSL